MNYEKGYLYGALFGDGCLQINPKHGHYRISFEVKDVDFLDHIEMCFKSLYNEQFKRFSRERMGRIYHTRYYYGKKKIYQLNDDFQRYFEYAQNNKTFRRAFLKGFADADGSVSIYYQKYYKKNGELATINKNRRIRFTKAIPKLKEVKQLLKMENINSRIYRIRLKGKLQENYARLELSGLKNCKTFFDNIGFIIQRKYNKLQLAIQSIQLDKKWKLIKDI